MTQKKIVRVREVMKSNFDIVDGKMTVMAALETMKHVETKSLIVQKRNDSDEYGMVLISDIAKHVLAKDRSPSRVNVFEIMSKPVISVSPDMDIRYCARLFENFGLARAPVVENGNVVGIVSFTDMVLKGLVEFD
ncbi:MAG: CBS domain-containing protein [Gammaproteobacteria bacterium]|nr:CBS domain-containing protein [Gammaproteobacteria bacterium]